MKTTKILFRIGSILLLLLFVVMGIRFTQYEIRSSKAKNVQTTYTENGSVDNESSVQNYTYTSIGLVDTNVLLLKDLEYGFLESIRIPGMPETKDSDFISNIIFSESQCPQGLCFTDDFVLVTSYSDEDDCLGEVLVFDAIDGEYLFTLGMDAESHLGGIAFDGKNIWVCNSANKTIERISYDFIQLMALQNPGEFVDATGVVDIYPVNNTPSCITFYGDRLWIATHTVYFDSVMVAYHYDDKADSLNALSQYKLPKKVQGIAFDENGNVILSTSYGRKSSSYLMIYDSVVSLSTHPKRPKIQIEMPPGSEEIDVHDGTIYVIFESAGERYIEGTDGRGKSVCPIDKILTIDLESINP